jgi:ATP-dependent helicase STH1/SNF2
MNDEELNVIIARTDEETDLFRDIDIKRERDAIDAWRAAGNRGKPPPPLMQFEELPECYQTDEPFEVKEVDESLEGRGQRRRNVVSYNDGLSDEQWAMVSIVEARDAEECSFLCPRL